MSVICHGMSLPLSEHETIKDCVNVYCEWLTALFQTPKISVPQPICEDPNLYARKIINHFHNLFVPRQGEGEANTHTTHIPCILCYFLNSRGKKKTKTTTTITTHSTFNSKN